MRLLRYLFTRRLAVQPFTGEGRMLFRWQRMPDGWRWF